MENLAPSEVTMWEAPEKASVLQTTDEDINRKYAKRELRIITESNREQLPNFVEAFKRKDWMNLRPFYQRRPRWSPDRQSKLIESFIMNIPVPPLFVYESDLARYEVMDGQQRITAIIDFYANRFALEGLEQWPELNGKIYDKLPSEIRKGIDRRSISYIVLLKESAPSTEDEMLLRQQVFERLNTGGVALSNQEVRNSIYQSKFSKLLDDMSQNPAFRSVWGIPPGKADEKGRFPDDLAKDRLFSTMRDTEIVLRFFALRQAQKYRLGMKGFLDRYMLRARSFGDDDIIFLTMLFTHTMDLAYGLYGETLFRPWDHRRPGWADRPQVALSDAVMVACSRHLDDATLLLDRRGEVLAATQDLLEKASPGSFTGQRNTKGDVIARIDAFDGLLTEVLSR